MPKVTDEHREARCEQILAAARRCFLRQGFHETSMQDLLAEAGLSSGAVYGYFASKEDVIAAIAEQNISEVLAVMRESAASASRDSAGDALASILDLVRAKNAQNGFATMAVLVWSEATRNPALRARLDALLDELQVDFGGFADAEQLPAGVEPESFGNVLASIVAGFILQLAVIGPDSSEDLSAAVRALWPTTSAAR
jgi:TetR/AcrR family transcriptional regulator, transcriptional repressor of aconitase